MDYNIIFNCTGLKKKILFIYFEMESVYFMVKI